MRVDGQADRRLTVEIGVYTFAELRGDPASGAAISPEQRLRDLLEEVELAEQVSLDVFGVGEHHRPDFAVSAPAVVLAAAAARTKRIRLTSAVSVLSSDDPVRVFQEFSTLDLLSGGRSEIMVGRGSFIESFPLFGYDLADYDALFAEKLELLLELRASEHVAWSGRHRPELDGLGVYPRPVQDPLPIWVAVGGTPESAVRAGTLGLPMALAIIGGQPERFAPFAELHRQAARTAGHDPLPALSINSHAYVADTPQQAADEFFPSYAAMMNAIGRERGWSPIAHQDFDALRSPRGALVVGSPQEVIEKILFQHEIFGHKRFLGQISVGFCRTETCCGQSSSSVPRSPRSCARRLPAAPERRRLRPRNPARAKRGVQSRAQGRIPKARLRPPYPFKAGGAIEAIPNSFALSDSPNQEVDGKWPQSRRSSPGRCRQALRLTHACRA